MVKNSDTLVILFIRRGMLQFTYSVEAVFTVDIGYLLKSSSVCELRRAVAVIPSMSISYTLSN